MYNHNENLAGHVFVRDEFFFCTCGANARELRTCSNTPIAKLCKMKSSITINDCAVNPVDVIVVRDGRKHIGRDLFTQLGLSIQQSNVNKTVLLKQHD